MHLRIALLFILIAANTSILSTSELPSFSSESMRSNPIRADRIVTNNPFNRRKDYCAAFARYGLWLLTGKRYITFGSAERWASHASEKKAVIPLADVQPGNLIFFRNGKGRINHVAIVLSMSRNDSGAYTITFQDEHGTNLWWQARSQKYLGMKPEFGADPVRLEYDVS